MHCKIVHIVFTVFTVRKAKKRLRWVGGRSSMTFLLRRGRDVKRKNLTESATTQITVIQTFISTTFNMSTPGKIISRQGRYTVHPFTLAKIK